MSHQSWFCSDHHLNHANILNFDKLDGSKLRVFEHLEDMHETIIARHNSVVKPYDRVYFLGDVAINKGGLPFIERMNGKKVLIMGNHDIFPATEYLKYFEDVRAYKVFPKHRIICSHIPVHPHQLDRWNGNVHGHLHAHLVRVRSDPAAYLDFDPVDLRYLNVCMEQINYTPINLDQILNEFRSRGVYKDPVV